MASSSSVSVTDEKTLTATVLFLGQLGGRHCEPTGRANAHPMTGSAKQSRRPQARKMDCFVAEFIIGPAEGGTRWLLAMTGFVMAGHSSLPLRRLRKLSALPALHV